ncbi:22569_t:CDS:1, partial [Gigaspora rosea]
ELVQKSKKKSKVPLSKSATSNIKEQNPKMTRETSKTQIKSKKYQFQDSCESESSKTIEQTY